MSRSGLEPGAASMWKAWDLLQVERQVIRAGAPNRVV